MAAKKPTAKKDIDGEDVRQSATDKVMEERFGEKEEVVEKIKVAKHERVLTNEEVWLSGMTTAMTNLGTKTVKDLNTAMTVADGVLELFKKKFR